MGIMGADIMATEVLIAIIWGALCQGLATSQFTRQLLALSLYKQLDDVIFEHGLKHLRQSAMYGPH